MFQILLISYNQGNSNSGHELPHRDWHKLDVPQNFVELTHQNLGYSQGNSVRLG